MLGVPFSRSGGWLVVPSLRTPHRFLCRRCLSLLENAMLDELVDCGAALQLLLEGV